ncbi:TetR/AcrR family transcriptional regulator [Erwinia sp. BNK-24-b]|uniref:TetR/AcrR family transcriptional regulator n=1 Tax=Erwinia TaxID=551 RepID=UPI001FEF6C7A|nr:TetR/AcrR family transcriptional regulator [Erwinia phyllosphaerae]MBV4365320.1 TetR/AcrR family transcriptional regulator [Erwinia phyllosphaerae]
MTESVQVSPRGRPRRFNEEQVLDRAIELFSTAGYSAVGINDLARVTGLKVGSIYKAWQSKENFFAKALQRYIALRETQICHSPTKDNNARARIAGLLHLYVRLSQGKDGALGCMMVTGITEIPNFSFTGDILRQQIASRRQLLSDLVALGQHDGSITCTTPPAIVADILIALLYGMRVLGKAESFINASDADVYVAAALRILDQ